MSFAAMLPLLASLAGGALSGLGGSKGETKSTYGKPARSLIDEIIGNIKGQGGQTNIQNQQGFQQGNDFFQSLFNDPEFFNKFEGPAFRQFNEEILPGVANRFASQGSGGSLGSTGFRNALGRESSNLATNLAAQRGQMQQNQIPNMLQYSQQPFNQYQSLLQNALTPTQNVYQPPSSGFFGGIAPSLIGGLSQGYGQQLGQQMGNSFGGQSFSTF